MSWKNPADRWGAVSQAFHWLIVALILVMAYLGLSMVDMPNTPDKIGMYGLHKSIGISLLVLVLLRLLWRLYAGAPRGLAEMPAWQARAASLTHGLLYALLLALPVSGWILNSASGFPLRWFGMFGVPAIAARSQRLHALATSTHEVLFWTLAVLALAHAAAAFHHHLFRGDATLARMLPRNWLGFASPGTAPAEVARPTTGSRQQESSNV